MRVPPEQIQIEQFRSFDPLASVDLYRFDLLTYGQILQETEQRGHNEELTYIAEGLNRPLYTRFSIEERDGELVYFDRGRWVPYISMLERGNQVAEKEALADGRKAFTAERTAYDLVRGYRMRELRPGESMAWASKFPEKECQLYGEEFVSSLGYQPKRRMGFLYYAERLETGQLVLHTQSVDNSNDEAFETALEAGSCGVVAMRERYDETMAQTNGGSYYAGRAEHTFVSQENAWEVIKTHKDLVGYYFEQIKKLAANTLLPRPELETAKKQLTYGVWAALKERIDKTATNRTQGNFAIGYDPIAVGYEVQHAYQELSRRGEALFGCGGSITGENAVLGADGEQVFEAIFGGKNEILKCVTCPLCRRSGVDAHIKHEAKQKTITCSKCRGSKTYAK